MVKYVFLLPITRFIIIFIWAHNIQTDHQIERLCSEDTPTPTPSPHDYPYYILLSHIGSQVKRRQSQSYKFKGFAKISIFLFWNNHYTRHTFWSCLIRYANMKWIRRVFLKIQSGHDSVHRRTEGRMDRWPDRQGETSITPFQLRWGRGMIIRSTTILHDPQYFMIIIPSNL